MSADWHRFPPHVLREYSVLADGYRGALCGPRGDIAWMCAPKWHDSAVFSALLGGAGVYAINPVEPCVWGGSYEPRTLIWRNRWITTSTVVECREALAYPGNPDRVVLLRRIEAAARTARVRVELDVRAGFGEHAMRELSQDDSGRWSGRSGDLALRWSGAAEAVPDRYGVLRCELEVPAGEHRDIVLELCRGSPGSPPDPVAAWRTTETAWRDSVPDLAEAAGVPDATHAYAVLRGLTAPGGGMVAAATTSLPERAEEGRNYDYRFSWVRDQCYAGIAAAAAGGAPVLDDATAFLTARVLEDADALRPAYTIDGGPVPDERRLDLPGYPGGQTVVSGNRATRQFQLDSYGEVLQLLAAAEQHERLDADGRRAVRVATDAIGKHWREPEAGVWELDERWWTHSRLACVAGLRGACRAAPSARDSRDMLELADAIMAETARRCLHRRGHWQRSADLSEPDAALLLPLIRGALPADDPRTGDTVDAVRATLARDDYVYRFPQAPDPLGTDEGAFLMCGFVLALAERRQGHRAWALRRFERNRAACGPPGLFSEEYDVRQRQLRGNLPQAFVHALMLECAVGVLQE